MITNTTTNIRKQVSSILTQIREYHWYRTISPAYGMHLPTVQQHLHEVEANQDFLYEQTSDLSAHADSLHSSKQGNNVFWLNLPAIASTQHSGNNDVRNSIIQIARDTMACIKQRDTRWTMFRYPPPSLSHNERVIYKDDSNQISNISIIYNRVHTLQFKWTNYNWMK